MALSSSTAPSIIGEGDGMSEVDGMSGSEGDGDLIGTPGSWSEVGSMVSEE